MNEYGDALAKIGDAKMVIADENALPATKGIIAFALEMMLGTAETAEEREVILAGYIALAMFRTATEVAENSEGMAFNRETGRRLRTGDQSPPPAFPVEAFDQNVALMGLMRKEGDFRLQMAKDKYPWPEVQTNEALEKNYDSLALLIDSLEGEYEVDRRRLLVKRDPDGRLTIRREGRLGMWRSAQIADLRFARRTS